MKEPLFPLRRFELNCGDWSSCVVMARSAFEIGIPSVRIFFARKAAKTEEVHAEGRLLFEDAEAAGVARFALNLDGELLQRVY